MKFPAVRTLVTLDGTLELKVQPGSAPARRFESMERLLAEISPLIPNAEKVLDRPGRMGLRTKLVLAAAAFAVRECGFALPDSCAVLGFGVQGSREEDRIYWNDYCVNGRVSGRGHLFVGTLATTPLCQVSMAFGLHGEVCYQEASAAELAEECGVILSSGRTETLLLLGTDFPRVCAAVVRNAESGTPDPMLKTVFGGMP